MANRFGFVVEDVIHFTEEEPSWWESCQLTDRLASGDSIRIVRNGATILTGSATLQGLTTRGKHAMLVSDEELDVRTGDVVEAEQQGCPSTPGRRLYAFAGGKGLGRTLLS